jgi:RimJ/RimL family protein N-acetyltransferase
MAQVTLKDGRVALIRQAVPDDAQAATDYVRTITSEKTYLLRDRVTWTIDEERKTIAAADGKDGVFIIAEISGRLCGMITFARGRWPKNAHVADLGITCLPDCRGVGLGTALMTMGIEWARSVGVKKLTLTVFATNDRAMALYLKMGFKEEARLKGQFNVDGKLVDAVHMALWL